MTGGTCSRRRWDTVRFGTHSPAPPSGGAGPGEALLFAAHSIGPFKPAADRKAFAWRTDAAGISVRGASPTIMSRELDCRRTTIRHGPTRHSSWLPARNASPDCLRVCITDSTDPGPSSPQPGHLQLDEFRLRPALPGPGAPWWISLCANSTPESSSCLTSKSHPRTMIGPGHRTGPPLQRPARLQIAGGDYSASEFSAGIISQCDMVVSERMPPASPVVECGLHGRDRLFRRQGGGHSRRPFDPNQIRDGLLLP